MLADDSNVSYAEENTKTLLDTVNMELQKFSQWFIFNKLSPNVTKKFSFFHKHSNKDNIPLVLLKLNI